MKLIFGDAVSVQQDNRRHKVGVRRRGLPATGAVVGSKAQQAAARLPFIRTQARKSELALTSLRLAFPVVKRAALSPEKANATETGRACRIGDVRADLSRIGIFNDFHLMLRR
jgi:hypothetical protein